MPVDDNDRDTWRDKPYLSAEQLRPRTAQKQEPDAAVDDAERDNDEHATQQTSDELDDPQEQPPTTAASAPKKSLKRRLIGVGALLVLLALIGWIVAETVTRSDSGNSYSPGATSSESKADPASVRVAVESRRLILTGNTKSGCALYTDPAGCERVWGGTKRTFTERPHAIDSAHVAEDGDDPAATVAVVQYSHPTGGNTVQRWAVLVRDSDHKVIGTESLGAAEAELTLVEVGQKIREDN